MTDVSQLDTPALLVDLDRMERNIERWQRLADDAGVRFRVHVKTHKVPAIAHQQLAAGACGIVCAKVAEAEVFVAAGCADVVVAYPIFGDEKWRRLAALAEAVRGSVSTSTASKLLRESRRPREQWARRSTSTSMSIRGCTAAVSPQDAIEELSQLCAEVERLGGVELAGVTTHRQLGYAGVGELTPDQAGRDEGARLVEVAEQLRRRGHAIREVAAGGSITGRGVAAADGVTELRAGTYVFNDLMQLAAGSAGEDDLALTVLCSVVSTRQPGGATVDGGSKTFTSERGADGFARALDREIVLDRLSEEHGMAVVAPGTTA